MISSRLLGRIVVALVVVGIVAASVAPLMAQQPQPAQQNDFVPLKDLPAHQEQLPAAPLVMAAYAFVWVALLVYVWSVWRRVSAVQRELTELRRRAERKA